MIQFVLDDLGAPPLKGKDSDLIKLNWSHNNGFKFFKQT